MHLRLDEYESPCSRILLVTDAEGALRALEFADHEVRMRRLLRDHYCEYELETDGAPANIMRSLAAYFEGDLTALDEIQVATGGTMFQRAVWKALRKIKPGTTRTYGQLAAELGRVTASRAVGAANRANPVAIVVPCHRVIGANGTLTGYAGGLHRKQWLLGHEGYYDAAMSQLSLSYAGSSDGA
jgi:methylated-DNA-[protein]-cysteine S-methyltransferase